jgi:macrolide-specific efflux system membrane fusion protein
MKTFSTAMLFLLSLATVHAEESIHVSRATVLLDRQVEIPAQEVGVLATIKVKPGSAIKAGETLAELDSTEAQLALVRAQIDHSIAKETANSDVEIQAAKKSRDVSKADLKRSQLAVDRIKNAVSETQLDRLKLSVERAELAIQQAELVQRTSKLKMKLTQNDIDQANRVIDRHIIKSSLTGIVDQVNRQPGEWVKPGDAVFRVLQLDRLRCEGFVSASLLQGNMTGRKVKITVFLDEEQERSLEVIGKLVFIGSEINSIKGDVRIRAEFDNPKLRIRPGMTAKMEILPRELAKTAPQNRGS